MRHSDYSHWITAIQRGDLCTQTPCRLWQVVQYLHSKPDTDTQITLILYRLLSFHSDTQTTPTLTQTIPNCSRTYRLLPFLLRHPDCSKSQSDWQITLNFRPIPNPLTIQSAEAHTDCFHSQVTPCQSILLLLVIKWAFPKNAICVI